MLLMPFILFGTLLAAIPVVIHLLHRQKTTPVEWGAMQFLLATPVSQRRSRRIEHWFILLVRTALLLLLVALLARPILLQSKYNPLASSTAADIAVVIDHSLSMGRKAGDQSLYEQSLAQLDQIIQLMRPTDKLTIVLAEHTPRELTRLPTNKPEELQDLRDQLRVLKPGLTDASLPAAVHLAKNQINKGGNVRKIIFILTDDQRSGWLAEDDNAWRAALGDRDNGPDKDVAVYALPVHGAATTPNVSVSALSVGSGLVGLSRPVGITATLSNAGPGPMPSFPVRLLVNGQAAGSQQVPALDAGQSHTVRFEYVFTAPGSQWAAVQAEVVDALDADNRMVAAVNVWDKLPVLIVDGALTDVAGFPSSAFLQAAMEPDDAHLAENAIVQPKIVSVTEATRTRLDDYAVVVFNDVPRLPADFANRIADYVLSGHGAWFILGPRTEKSFLNDTLAKTALFPAKAGDVRKITLGDRGLAAAPAIDIRDPDHGTVALLTAAERNALPGVAVTQWWQLADLGDQTRTVLATSTEGNDPLVVAHDVGRSGGRVVLWTTNADGSWNNLPLAHNFVPLVNETLFHLAAGTSAAQHRRLDAGQRLDWNAPTTPQLAAVEILRPDGRSDRLIPQITNGRYVISYADTHLPGLYEVKSLAMSAPAASAANPPSVFYSVNIDRRELDPTLISDSDMSWFKERNYLKDRINPDGLAAALGAENRGTELWPYAALAVLAALVMETWLTRRAVKLQSGVDVAKAGLPGGGVYI